MLVAPVLRKLADAERSGHTGSVTSRTAWPHRSGSPRPRSATAAELSALSDNELDERFSQPLTFGTAGLRGPMRDGPGRHERRAVRPCDVGRRQGAQGPLPGRIDRRGRPRRPAPLRRLRAGYRRSACRRGLLRRCCCPTAAPTPVVAFAVRHSSAAAGVQITASHNPPADNGYKVYFDGGMQIVPPDRPRDRSAPIADAPSRRIARRRSHRRHRRWSSTTSRARRTCGTRTGRRAGRADADARRRRRGRAARRCARPASPTSTSSPSSSRPTPTSPPSRSPTPRSPAPPTLLLALAADVDADVAIALDPDADRCAVGIPTPSGWRMLSGDETGWLLGDYILSQTRSRST